MKKLLLLFSIFLHGVVFAAPCSTINPAVPANGSALISATVRNNFANAYSDVNNLFSQSASAVAPLSPCVGQLWLNTTSTPYVLSEWDGASWVEIGTLNATTHAWAMPPASLPLGTSVNNPGTGVLEHLTPTQTVTGTNYTFSTADLFKKTRRSNSGTAMSDTLPGATATGIVNGTQMHVSNVDASAVDTITAGAGTTIAGSSTFILQPSRDIWFDYDAPNTAWRPIANTSSVVVFTGTPPNASQLYGGSATPGNSSVYGTSGSGTTVALTNGASLSSPSITTPTINTPTVTGLSYESTSPSVSAAGSSQGTATALTSLYNVVTTVASGTGVLLPTPASPGAVVSIVNKGANALLVYPNSGASIDGGSANAAVSIPVNAAYTVQNSSTTQWYTLDPVIAGTSNQITVTSTPGTTTIAIAAAPSITGTNITGTASGLTAGTATVANGIKSATTTVTCSAATAPSANQYLVATNSTTCIWQSLPPYITVPNGYINGFGLSNDGITPNTVLDIASGFAADSTNAVMITGTAFTKTVSGTWVAGSGNAGMGTGLTVAASTWYHVFAIINNGNFDVYFDTSATAANKPASTTAFRYIGSMKTDASSHILAFYQTGQIFTWVVNTFDIAGGGTTSAALYTLNVPPGFIVYPMLDVNTTGANAFIWSPGIGSTAPSVGINFASQYSPIPPTIATNTSSQVYAKVNTATDLNVQTLGYVNPHVAPNF